MTKVPEAPTNAAPRAPVTTFSIEEGTETDKRFEFSTMSIRKSFLRKVYGILTCQLLLTVGVILLFMMVEPVKLWTRENPKFLLGALIVTFVCVVSMACCDGMRRRTPMNLICLGMFTAAESVLLGFISAFYHTDVVLMAAATTAVICVALTIYAYQTKADFTICGGLVICLIIGLLIFGNLAVTYYKNNVLIALYVSGGAMICSFIFIMDTQLIVEGVHTYSISPEEYVFAALNLYLGIVNLFLYILRCISCDCDEVY